MSEELIIKLQDAYQQSKGLEEKAEIIEQQLIELDKFRNVLNDLEKNKDSEILAPVGKNVFAKSKIIEDTLFVDAGAGIFVRKTLEETREVVEDQLRRLGEMQIELSIDRESTDENLRDLIQDYEESVK